MGEDVQVLSLLRTIAETAETLRVSERTVKRIIARGDLSVVEVVGRTMVETSEIAAFISRNRRRRGAAA
jgi:excisionase family DNA binding protein